MVGLLPLDGSAITPPHHDRVEAVVGCALHVVNSVPDHNRVVGGETLLAQPRESVLHHLGFGAASFIIRCAGDYGEVILQREVFQHDGGRCGRLGGRNRQVSASVFQAAKQSGNAIEQLRVIDTHI